MIVTIKRPDYDNSLQFQFMTHERAVEFINFVVEHCINDLKITFVKEDEDDTV